MLTLEQAYPPLGLRIRCADLELRLPTDADLPALIEEALAGVHPVDFMPFTIPWTQTPPDQLPSSYVQFDASTRRAQPAGDFILEFMVLHQGRPVGRQAVSGHDFARLRSVSTGSWLGMHHQGQGIGTLMRQLVLSFAFDQLGAEVATTEAFADNAGSNGVSRKIGYRENGRSRATRGDGWGWQQHYLMFPDDLVRPTSEVTYEGVDAFRTMIRLDA